MYGGYRRHTPSPNPRQPPQNPLPHLPQLIQPLLQILNVRLVDAARLIGLLRILVQIVAADPKEPHQLSHILQIQPHTVAVQCHLPKIRPHAADSHLPHFLMNPLHFLFTGKEVYVPVPDSHQSTSS